MSAAIMTDDCPYFRSISSLGLLHALLLALCRKGVSICMSSQKDVRFARAAALARNYHYHFRVAPDGSYPEWDDVLNQAVHSARLATRSQDNLIEFTLPSYDADIFLDTIYFEVKEIALQMAEKYVNPEAS